MSTNAQVAKQPNKPPAAIHVSSIIYLFLWLAGLPISFYSFYKLQDESHLGLNEALTSVLAVTSTILLALIYFDMDKIEKINNEDHDYPGWVGANRRLEVILRVLIVICLLFAVGELHTVQQVCHGIVDYLQSEFGFGPDSSYVRVVTFIKKSDIFVLGSCGAFASIAAWNFGALIYRCGTFKEKKSSLKGKDSEAYAHYLIVFPRILIFTALASICSLYWFLVWVVSKKLTSFATIFVLVYTGCVLFVFFLRFKRPRQWLEKKMVDVFL